MNTSDAESWKGSDDPGGVALQKTIKFSVYFFTDRMGKDQRLVPKKAWEQGVVELVSNKRHGIRSSVKEFHHFEDIEKTIKYLARSSHVKIYRGKFSKEKGRRFV